MPGETQSAIGRADLVRIQRSLGEAGVRRLAASIGFATVAQSEPSLVPEAAEEPVAVPLYVDKSESERPYRHESIEVIVPRSTVPAEPKGPLVPRIPGAQSAPQGSRELVRWRLREPELERLLAESVAGNRVDIARLVQNTSLQRVTRTLPKSLASRMPRRIFVLVERTWNLVPLWDEQYRIIEGLRKRFKEVWFRSLLDGESFHLRNGHWKHLGDLAKGRVECASERLVRIVPGDCLLALGELKPANQARRRFWGRVSAQCTSASIRLVAVDVHAASSSKRVPCVSWEQGLKESAGNPNALLCLMSPAVRVEAGLLREFRTALGNEASVLEELTVWRHADVLGRTSMCVALDEAPRRQWLKVWLSAWDGESPSKLLQRDIQRKCVGAMREWHSESAEVWHEEVFGLYTLRPAHVAPKDWLVLPEEVTVAVNFLEESCARLATLERKEQRQENMVPWFKRLSRRLPQKAWAFPELACPLALAWEVVHSDSPAANRPETIAGGQLAATSSGRRDSRWSLLDIDGQLTLLPAGEEPKSKSGLTNNYRVLVGFVSASQYVFVTSGEKGSPAKRLGGNLSFIERPATSRFSVETATETFVFSRETPDWATEEFGPARLAGIEELRVGSLTCTMHWVAPVTTTKPGTETSQQSRSGFWINQHPLADNSSLVLLDWGVSAELNTRENSKEVPATEPNNSACPPEVNAPGEFNKVPIPHLQPFPAKDAPIAQHSGTTFEGGCLGTAERSVAGQQTGTPASAEAFNWMSSVANAMSTLSTERIVHRDVVPANLLVCTQGSSFFAKLNATCPGLGARAATLEESRAGATKAKEADFFFVIRGTERDSKEAPPVGHLVMLARNEPSNVKARLLLARHECVPISALKELAGDTDSRVRCCVATNSSTPRFVLFQLAGDTDGHVRSCVANNPTTSRYVLHRLADDADERVRCVAGRHLSERIRKSLHYPDGLSNELMAQLTRDGGR